MIEFVTDWLKKNPNPHDSLKCNMTSRGIFFCHKLFNKRKETSVVLKGMLLKCF